MTLPVTFVPWKDISSLLAPTPERRQALAGFDADYVDIVDYIVRCTHRIWEGKNLDLIRTHYTDDCLIHTLAGPTRGVEAVIAGTLSTLQAFPDRTLCADHVIWSDDGPRGYHSSHRITSHMTHLGDNDFGPASRRRATVVTIADCAVRANRIYEEWLVRDNWSLAAQLGFDPTAIATMQAGKDRSGSPVCDWWQTEHARARSQAAPARSAADPQQDAAGFAHYVFGNAWNQRRLGVLREVYSPTVEWNGPAGRRLFGAGAATGFIASILAAFPDALVAVDHVAAVPFFDLGVDIAVRWTLAGAHRGPGLHGPATGLPVTLLAVTHWRAIDGQIVEERTVYDEIALLRQLRQGQ
jgi:predicted ester cyclase